MPTGGRPVRRQNRHHPLPAGETIAVQLVRLPGFVSIRLAGQRLQHSRKLWERRGVGEDEGGKGMNNFSRKELNDYEIEYKRIDSLTEDQARREAQLNSIKIYDELEKKAEKIKPEVFVPHIVSFFNDPERELVIAPHIYLQAIEANCAFYKEVYDEMIDWNKFADIVNLCIKLEEKNTFYLWAIHKNINLFYQFVNRIQFEIQKTGFSKTHLARYWKLFYDNPFTPNLCDQFEVRYKISIKNWFLSSLCTYTVFYKSLVASKKIVLPDWINLTANDIHSYLSYNVCSVIETKERYIDIRKHLPNEFHFLIRSIFTERPILELNQNAMIAPIPELIIRNIGKGLITLFEQIDKDGYYLGQSFERYTESILKCLKTSLKLYTKNELERQPEGQKNCDFLIITPTENILLECKAIDFRVRTLTEKAISNSSATTRIIGAIEQLSNTYNNIKTGQFNLNGLDNTKPFVGIIVTLGEFPGFNTDWFFEKVIPSNNTKNKTKDRVRSFLQSNRPVVLSIDCLEELVMYLNSCSQSLIDLYDFKTKQDYFMTGDWDAFLSNKLKEIEIVENIDFVDESVTQMYKELGFDSELMKIG